MRRSLPSFALVLILAACSEEATLPGVDDGAGGGGGSAAGGSGGTAPGGSGGTAPGGSGGGGGTAFDPLAGCTAAGAECNGGVCDFANLDCEAAADGLLAQCNTGLCGMRDRDGNCQPRAGVVEQCERERYQDAAANSMWHCFIGSTACDTTFTECNRNACNPND
jgi:hypothetical protein